MMSRAALAGGALLRSPGGGYFSRLIHHRSPASSCSEAIAIEIEIRPQIQQVRRIPWLLLSSPSKPESRFLYDLTQRQIAREIHLPQIAGHAFIGSSHGFLFTADRNGMDIHATNPLTGAHLHRLPSTASLPNMLALVRDPSGNLIHYVTKHIHRHQDQDLQELAIKHLLYQDLRGSKTTSLLATLENPRETHKQLMPVEFMGDFYQKAILSPSSDTAVVMFSPHHGEAPQELAFAQVNNGCFSTEQEEEEEEEEEAKWTALNTNDNKFHDIIFHNGRLHAIDGFCGITIFDLDSPSGPHFESPERKEDAFEGHYPTEVGRFLVESPDGRDLFAVYRGIDDDHEPCRTKTFKVLKLDKSDYKWELVESIGDLAFFVGMNSSSVSVSAADFLPGVLEPNSIYFTDSLYSEEPEEVGDTGVFHLEDGGIELYPLTDGVIRYNSSPPIWFMPPAIC